jgi:hypothetical protein
VPGRLGEISDDPSQVAQTPFAKCFFLPENLTAGGEVAEEGFDEGAFATAVGTDDGDDFASLKGHRNIAEGGAVSVGELEIAGD